MKKFKKITSFSLVLIFSIFTAQHVDAKQVEEGLPVVSVINEIRGPQLGLEGRDLLESLRGQWMATKEAEVPATWLWQYSALEDKKLIDFAKREMSSQEYGIFLEIDRNFAEKAGVRYRGKGAWYFSDGLFLVSYEPSDRLKLIDKAFEKFRDEFGYYPKTVGAWWVGADTISYMQKKYSITAVLQCADQFNTDKYSIWGTPWSIPYLPSSRNAAIPANNYSDRISDVVILQWATRDPVSGYGESVFESTYSLQDYAMKKYETDEYLSYFRNIYLNKPLDHMVLGLEGGFGPGVYQATYKDNLLEFKEWEKEGYVEIQTAGEYASDFIESRRILPPTSHFLTEGFKVNDQSFWYISPNYRILFQKQGDSVYLSDFRDYLNAGQEDFYELPNTEALLRINTKSIIDSIRFPKDRVKLLSSDKPLVVVEDDGNKILKTGGETVAVLTDSTVSLPTVNKSWEFNQPVNTNAHPNYNIITVLIALAYVVFLYIRKNKKLLSVGSITSLLFGFVVFYPLYSSGQFFNELIKFTPISLSIFDFMNLGILNPGLKMFIYFQFIPLAIILLLHYFLLIKPKNTNLSSLIFLAIVVMAFLYLDNFYSRFLSYFVQGRRAMLISVLSIAGLLGFIFFLFYLHRTGKNKLFASLLVLSMILFIWFNQNKIFAHKNYIITGFEWEMLNTVHELREDVFYPVPEFKAENYHNTFPLLAVDKSYAEKITSVNWRKLSYDDRPVRYAGKENIVVLSRYIGVELEEEISLEKIMDNGQIAVYKFIK